MDERSFYLFESKPVKEVSLNLRGKPTERLEFKVYLIGWPKNLLKFKVCCIYLYFSIFFKFLYNENFLIPYIVKI